ncbi:MAG: IclR family transcriptional regulator, partial [Psychrobacter sp.]|nr:IclR family transcriptional regulator [Psychrobacter sp.]
MKPTKTLLTPTIDDDIGSKANSAMLSDSISDTLNRAKSEDDRAFISALGRGMLILSVFEDESQLSHQQICQKTQLPKATVSRLIYTLQALGLLRRGEDERYQLGANLLKLTASAWRRHNLVDDALPLLKDFAMTHQVSVNIATEIEGEMRYLACYRSPARLAVNLSVGSSVPLAQTAIGRAYYAVMSASVQQQILARISDAQDKSALNTIAQLLDLQTQFYNQYGYCLSDGDFSPDILAVAVPIYDHAKGHFTHAINASVPKANWSADDYIDFIIPKLMTLKKQI